MPRQADPKLETRILTAAQRLWAAGGHDRLTMRAVARAAGTNTPALYRRFPNRRALLRALVQMHRAALAVLIRRCHSLEEVCDCLLDYALRRPREYELITSRIVVSSDKPRPNFEYVVQKAGEWLGGEPESCRLLVIALWALVHGTAMLLIHDVIPEQRKAVRTAFRQGVRGLVRSHTRTRKR